MGIDWTDIDWSEVALRVLLVIIVVLVLLLIVYVVDQTFGFKYYAGDGVITGENTGVSTTIIYVNKIPIIQTHPYWTLSFTLNGEPHTSMVSYDCYTKTKIGDHVGITKDIGLFSVGYYPIC